MNGLNWHHDYCVYVGLCDMTNDDSLCEAVRLLCCIAMHVGTDLEFDRSTLTRNPKEMKVLLNPHSLHHMKPLKDFYACTAREIFSAAYSIISR